MVLHRIYQQIPLVHLFSLNLYISFQDEVDLTSIARYMLPLPAITSGKGFFVAPPEAGALIAAQLASQSIFTSSLSSLVPVLLIISLFPMMTLNSINKKN